MALVANQLLQMMVVIEIWNMAISLVNCQQQLLTIVDYIYRSLIGGVIISVPKVDLYPIGWVSALEKVGPGSIHGKHQSFFSD